MPPAARPPRSAGRRPALAAVLLLAALHPTPAGATTYEVRSRGGFEAAAWALRDSGGTVVLLPHRYRRELVVGERSWRPLHIVGRPGAVVQRLILYRSRQVRLSHLHVAPIDGDAGLDVTLSRNVLLDRLTLSARGTPWRARLRTPYSRHVLVRRSSFSHCGDRAPRWVFCLLPMRASHLTVEDSDFHDCRGCDFVHGRFGDGLTLRRDSFRRALPCHGAVKCSHQDLIELFSGRHLLVEDSRFGIYRRGGGQLYITNDVDHVRIVNNVFRGHDPRLPRYRAPVAIFIGARSSRRLPRDVRVVNNTILTGHVRRDGYAASIWLSPYYRFHPQAQRPLLANNVIELDRTPAVLCGASRSVRNVVVHGSACSRSDRVGRPHLDAGGRPTPRSRLLIGRASRRYAPARDMAGRRRGRHPDIGAYEYVR